MGTSGPLILEKESICQIVFRFFLWFLGTGPSSHSKTFVSFQWRTASMYFEEINYTQKNRC